MSTHLFSEDNNHFKLIVLGSGGGPFENDVSGYLLASKGSNDYIALDAGTLLGGISRAASHGVFSDIQPIGGLSVTGEVFLNHIKAYLISHAHLDHVAGLVIGSQSDSKKPIYAFPTVIDFMKDYLFNWKIWPNFGNEGEKPLNVYSYQKLEINKETSIPNTNFKIFAFPLSHPDDYLSTAFLIESNGHYLVYFGDTSSDYLEKKKDLFEIFEVIAPLIRTKKLQTILLESSYANHQYNELLFGHLDPKFLMDELHRLAELVEPKNPKDALKDFTVFVMHIKETLKAGKPRREIIQEELNQLNDLNVTFQFPLPGQAYEVK